MSNWSMAEVDELRQENGGGNVVNNATVFARFPEGAKVRFGFGFGSGSGSGSELRVS